MSDSSVKETINEIVSSISDNIEDLIYKVGFSDGTTKDITVNISQAYQALYPSVMHYMYNINVPLYGCFYWKNQKISDPKTLEGWIRDRLDIYMDTIKDRLKIEYKDESDEELEKIFKDIVAHFEGSEITIFICDDSDETTSIIVNAIDNSISSDQEYIMEDGESLSDNYVSLAEMEPEVYCVRPSSSMIGIISDLDEKVTELIKDKRYLSIQIINELIYRYKCAIVFSVADKSVGYMRYMYKESFVLSLADPFVVDEELYEHQDDITSLGEAIVDRLFESATHFVIDALMVDVHGWDFISKKNESKDERDIRYVTAMFIVLYMMGALSITKNENGGTEVKILNYEACVPDLEYQFYSVKTAEKVAGDGFKCDMDNLKGYPDAISNLIKFAPMDIKDELCENYFTAQISDVPVEEIRRIITSFSGEVFREHLQKEMNRFDIASRKMVDGKIYDKTEDDIRHDATIVIHKNICRTLKSMLDLCE